MKKLTIIVILFIVAALVAASWKSGLLPFTRGSSTTTTVISVSITTINTTTSSSSTTTVPVVVYPSCYGFGVNTTAANTTLTEKCSWTGGRLGVWAAAGGHGPVTIEVNGSKGATYVDTSFAYNCTTFVRNFSSPPQNLTLKLVTGHGAGSCGTALLKLNGTLVPQAFVIYPNVYNGDFSEGWTGWNVSGQGFRNGPGFVGPMNITWANKNDCWLSVPWNASTYDGNFFATSFTCGTSETFGTVTSSWFNVTKPFLNFRLVNVYNSNIYVQVMHNSTSYIDAYFDTINASRFASTYTAKSPNGTTVVYHNVTLGPTTFRNASIPLACFFGEPVRIRLVAATQESQTYMAAGDFNGSNIRSLTLGILVSLNVSHATCI